jgi:hypothetical protein
LTDDSPGTLFVVVNVACSVAEDVGRADEGCAVVGEAGMGGYMSASPCVSQKEDLHRASQRICSRGVDHLASLVELFVLIDVNLEAGSVMPRDSLCSSTHGEDWSKNLIDHRNGFGIFCQNNGRLDEESL